MRFKIEPRRETSRALVYGPDSKYGHPANGRVESVEAMTEADLKSHLRGRYSPSSATLVAVGRIDVDELMSRAEELFGEWASDGAAPDLGVGVSAGKPVFF